MQENIRLSGKKLLAPKIHDMLSNSTQRHWELISHAVLESVLKVTVIRKMEKIK